MEYLSRFVVQRTMGSRTHHALAVLQSNTKSPFVCDAHFWNERLWNGELREILVLNWECQEWFGSGSSSFEYLMSTRRAWETIWWSLLWSRTPWDDSCLNHPSCRQIAFFLHNALRRRSTETERETDVIEFPFSKTIIFLLFFVCFRHKKDEFYLLSVDQNRSSSLQVLVQWKWRSSGILPMASSSHRKWNRKSNNRQTKRIKARKRAEKCRAEQRNRHLEV